ncbi:hypothetical protein DFH11DRAFT_1629058 [Phellopilus nigrolimitatus]|nr:hypothetical protein DFH11DRAFT_1629058 [Phellopilus nigrolimitatus]
MLSGHEQYIQVAYRSPTLAAYVPQITPNPAPFETCFCMHLPTIHATFSSTSFFCCHAVIAHVESTQSNSQAQAGVSSARCAELVRPCSQIMTSGPERRRRARARRVAFVRHFSVSRLRALRRLKARKSRCVWGCLGWQQRLSVDPSRPCALSQITETFQYYHVVGRCDFFAHAKRCVLIFLPRNTNTAFLGSDDRLLKLAKRSPWCAGRDIPGRACGSDRVAHRSAGIGFCI